MLIDSQINKIMFYTCKCHVGCHDVQISPSKRKGPSLNSFETTIG